MHKHIQFLIVLITGLCLPTLLHAMPHTLNQFDKAGPILHWTLLGPFPTQPLESPAAGGVTRSGYLTDFLEELGGEANAAFQAGQPATGDLQAKAATALDSGWVDVPAFNRSVGYASTIVTSAQSRDAYLYFRSHGSPKVWVNGDQIIAGWKDIHPAKPWQYGLRLSLQEGENRILVKVDNRRGWWGFSCELIPVEEHDAVVAEVLRSVKFTTIGRDEDDTHFALVDFDRPVLDYSLPVDITVLTPEGVPLASTRAMTGQPAPLQIPASMTASIQVHASTALDSALKLEGDKRSYYTGNLPDEAAGLRERYTEIRGQVAQSAPEMTAALDWIDLWLVDPDRHNPADETDLRTLNYVRDLVELAENSRNIFIEQPDAVYPCLFSGEMPDGKAIRGEYQVLVPEGFWTNREAIGPTLPMLYTLHGSGGTGMKITANRDVDMKMVEPYLRVVPRATRDYRWDPDWLDILHDQVMASWPIDPDRVHLMGFSMGGYGTYTWGARRPERFATLVPQGAGMIFRGQDPRVVMQDLKQTPIWILMGGLDIRAADAIELFQLLRDDGFNVRFSLYGSKGHGGLGPVAEAEELEAWQFQHIRPNRE